MRVLTGPNLILTYRGDRYRRSGKGDEDENG